MLIVGLSNHPADMLDDASRRRQAAGKRALSRYEDELIQYRARVQAVRVKRDRARAEHRWGVWLRLVVAAWTRKRQANGEIIGKFPHKTLCLKLQMRSYAHPPTAPLDG